MLFDEDIQKTLTRASQYNNLSMVNFAQAVIPPIKTIKSVLQLLVNGPCTANNLAGPFPAHRIATFWPFGCMLKLGLLKISP